MILAVAAVSTLKEESAAVLVVLEGIMTIKFLWPGFAGARLTT